MQRADAAARTVAVFSDTSLKSAGVRLDLATPTSVIESAPTSRM
jgi:hypothetical protein